MAGKVGWAPPTITTMNETQVAVGSAHPTRLCRLIIDQAAPGAWNMAVDEALLAAAVDDGVATLRIYRWSESTLSLGYFQRYEDRRQHPASSACAVVRRQSGGGAILHDRELTYSLTLPARHSLARDATALYTAVHEAFVRALVPRLRQTIPSWSMTLNGKASPLVPAEEPFLCFQRRALGDLLLVPRAPLQHPRSASPTCKLLGSAQRRHRGAILQHGSLLLKQSPAAPELPGWQELTGEPLPPDTLIPDLVRQLSALLPVEAEPTGVPATIYDAAQEIERAKYASRSWTVRR